MIRALVLASLAFGHTTLAADSAPLSSEEVLDVFAARCSEIAADPEAVVSPSQTGQMQGFGNITDDKAMLFYNEEIKFSGKTYVELSFQRTQLPSRTETTCMFNITSLELDLLTPILPDLEDVLTSRAEALLGAPATKHGGDSSRLGMVVGHMLVWSTGDDPVGRLLTLNRSENNALLLLERVADAEI